MSDSEQNLNPIPIKVPATQSASRRVVSFSPSPRRVNFDSIYDPPVTTEGQEAHGQHDENIDPMLQPIEDNRYDFSSFPRRIKKGIPSPRLIRSQSQYGTSHSLAWSALRSFNDGLPALSPETPLSTPNDLRNIIYDEPALMSPGEESMYSVIVDDGSLQRRRISLTSVYSRQNVITEATSLLHGYDNSDSDIEDIDQKYNYNRYDSPLKAKIGKVRAWLFKNTFTQNQKNIIKCALAYFLASLFTFIPILNELTGLNGSPNIHLIASVAVFFNPAKTIGGMYEAVLFAILGGLYGSLIGIGSMASAVWFNDNNNYILGHVVSVVFWCGGSMFIVAFFRAKLNKPTFNSACSLANIIIFVVITKEGASYLGEFTMVKIIAVTKIILIGICISFLVSVCIWPVSASKKLKVEIGETLSSFRLLLKLLTKTFLIDDIRYTDKAVQSAIKSHQATFTSLKASLYQASHEIHNTNMQRQLEIYKEVIDSLQRLAQYLGGLRSCCGLQWEIIKDDETNKMNDNQGSSGNVSDDEEEFVDLGNLLEIIQRVGPSMKSLVFTCKQTMSHVQEEFIKSPTFSSAPSFALLHQNLGSALDLFEKSQTKSLASLYRKKTNNLDNRPNEEVFLTYFFIFNLQEFTRELMHLVDLVDRIQKIDSQGRRMRKWWQFWLCFGWFTTNDAHNDSTLDKKFDEKIKSKFPENTSNLFNTVQTPMPKTLPQKIAIRIWKSLSWFRHFEFKYALKAAISTAILTAPAFIDETRHIYAQYRGEWACISMMVVMVPTVGGANLIALYRAGGTIFGSVIACIIYSLFPENGILMSIFGFFIALGCFYFILCTKYNRMGQFILLTYNLVALYKFNLKNSIDDNLDIIDIARYRTIAVVIGIMWGVYVTAYWWPYEARVELRKGLSQLIINMSWLYNKLVVIYQPNRNDDTNSLNSTSQSLIVSAKEFVEMELFLQLSLIKLKELLSQTPNEPRMKGPFPVETYNKILIGCQNILDKLLSMRIAVTKEEWYTSIQKNFLAPITKERKDLVGNILLYFYILAGALKLKTPLPPYLPPAEKARKRLVKKIRDLPVVRQRIVKRNDVQYIVYYAYVLVMEDIIKELEKLGEIMKELFGVVGGDEFNNLFTKTKNDSIDSISGGSDGDNYHDDASGVTPHFVVQQQGTTTKDNGNKFDREFGYYVESSKSASSQDDAISKSTD